MLLANLLSPVLSAETLGRHVLPPEISQSKRISTAIDEINKRWDLDETDEWGAPIFVLSAGWGSGSTLVQRLVMSSGSHFIWGEPFDHAAVIHRLATTLTPINSDWPPDYHFDSDKDTEELSHDWIANLSPDIVHLKQAHRSFITSWLSEKKADAQWGLKEVRLTIDHAVYLKWLFPRAKFVFVIRDLYKSYLSCRRVPWWSVWPDYKVSPILHFAHHWRYITQGYLERHAEVGGMLIKYEDLISDDSKVLDSMIDYLELDGYDSSIMNRNVGARGAKRHPLILPEKILLSSVGDSVRKSMGYC